MLKKKLKTKKKKRLKEDVGLWEESRTCSNLKDEEPETAAAEPPSKKISAENGYLRKQTAGMVNVDIIHSVHENCRSSFCSCVN